MIMEKKKVLVVTKQVITYFTKVRRVKKSEEPWSGRWTRSGGQRCSRNSDPTTAWIVTAGGCRSMNGGVVK
jgi:hypothetical protein